MKSTRQHVTSPAGAFGCNYVTEQPSRLSRLLLPGDAHIANAFDDLGRMFSTKLMNASDAVLNSHSYELNPGNQRTKQTRSDGSFVDYDYDPLGQLRSALGKESGGMTNRLHEQFGYGYDAAGNVKQRTNNALVQAFNVNDVNEPITRTRTGTHLRVCARAQIIRVRVSVRARRSCDWLAGRLSPTLSPTALRPRSRLTRARPSPALPPRTSRTPRRSLPTTSLLLQGSYDEDEGGLANPRFLGQPPASPQQMQPLNAREVRPSC